MVLNDFDPKTKYYRIWHVEKFIRYLASAYPNTFHLAFYACCRELYDPARHSGGVGGTKEEVMAFYKKQDEEQKQAIAQEESKNAELQDVDEIDELMPGLLSNAETRGNTDLLPPCEIQNICQVFGC